MLAVIAESGIWNISMFCFVNLYNLKKTKKDFLTQILTDFHKIGILIGLNINTQTTVRRSFDFLFSKPFIVLAIKQY